MSRIVSETWTELRTILREREREGGGALAHLDVVQRHAFQIAERLDCTDLIRDDVGYLFFRQLHPSTACAQRGVVPASSARSGKQCCPRLRTFDGCYATYRTP